MPSVSPLELMMVLAIALIVLGPKRLPEVGRSLGRGLREFRAGISGDTRDEDFDYDDRPDARRAGESDA